MLQTKVKNSSNKVTNNKSYFELRLFGLMITLFFAFNSYRVIAQNFETLTSGDILMSIILLMGSVLGLFLLLNPKKLHNKN